jgi:hypothetical protein
MVSDQLIKCIDIPKKKKLIIVFAEGAARG